MRLPLLRLAGLVAWALLLITCWLLLRTVEAGPLEFLEDVVRQVDGSPWAPAGLLLLYLLRPLLLVPITVLNLASGLVFGALPGVALALAGTLISASMGYGIGRSLGAAETAAMLSRRWRFVRLIRNRGFEAVMAGGLMYCHADLVNLPAGMLRVHFPTFLLGITIGNSLTLTMAVLVGAAVEGELGDASLAVNVAYLAMAGFLLLITLVLARILRRRLRKSSEAFGEVGASAE